MQNPDELKLMDTTKIRNSSNHKHVLNIYACMKLLRTACNTVMFVLALQIRIISNTNTYQKDFKIRA